MTFTTHATEPINDLRKLTDSAVEDINKAIEIKELLGESYEDE